jgi:hypothetical protein
MARGRAGCGQPLEPDPQALQTERLDQVRQYTSSKGHADLRRVGRAAHREHLRWCGSGREPAQHLVGRQIRQAEVEQNHPWLGAFDSGQRCGTRERDTADAEAGNPINEATVDIRHGGVTVDDQDADHAMGRSGTGRRGSSSRPQ